MSFFFFGKGKSSVEERAGEEESVFKESTVSEEGRVGEEMAGFGEMSLWGTRFCTDGVFLLCVSSFCILSMSSFATVSTVSDSGSTDSMPGSL